MCRRVLIAWAGLILLISGVASALPIPCAGTTTVVATGNGSCAPDAAMCPNGDLDIVTVTVTVRDCYNYPLPGWMVTVTASPAGPPFFYCPDGEPPLMISRTLR
jgi:hypothetical protein